MWSVAEGIFQRGKKITLESGYVGRSTAADRHTSLTPLRGVQYPQGTEPLGNPLKQSSLRADFVPAGTTRSNPDIGLQNPDLPECGSNRRLRVSKSFSIQRIFRRIPFRRPREQIEMHHNRISRLD